MTKMSSSNKTYLLHLPPVRPVMSTSTTSSAPRHPLSSGVRSVPTPKSVPHGPTFRPCTLMDRTHYWFTTHYYTWIVGIHKDYLHNPHVLSYTSSQFLKSVYASVTDRPHTEPELCKGTIYWETDKPLVLIVSCEVHQRTTEYNCDLNELRGEIAHS